jgi:hemerythrin-like domain-containing protein
MKATEQLIHEHEAVTLMLNVLRSASDKMLQNEVIPSGHLDDMVDFLKVFVDKCHHGKEENILFPELVKKGLSERSGPVAVMLAEHEQGRAIIREMTTGIEAYKNGDKDAVRNITDSALSYIQLLTQHIYKENNILFKMADDLLSPEEQEEALKRFDELEERVIGPDKHEELHDRLHKLSEWYH